MTVRGRRSGMRSWLGVVGLLGAIVPTGTVASADPVATGFVWGTPSGFGIQTRRLSAVELSGNGATATAVLRVAGDVLRLEFAAPEDETLRVESYSGVGKIADITPSRAGIGLTGSTFLDGPISCAEPAGWFAVDEVEYAGSDISSLAVRFEVRCDGRERGIIGAFAYNADLEYPVVDVNGVLPFEARDEPSSPQQVLLLNRGPGPVHVTEAALGGADAADFEIVDDACSGSTLGVDEACAVSVRFASRSGAGDKHADLRIFSDLTPRELGSTGFQTPLQGAYRSTLGEFTPVTPHRVFDTRDGTGGHLGALGTGEAYGLRVVGVGGVPAEGVSAVVVNATSTGATAPTFVTVWPWGFERPEISNLNVLSGVTVPNLVTVAVGDDGRVGVFNAKGASDVIFDVVGYYATPEGPEGSRFEPVNPVRVIDTRTEWDAQGSPVAVGPNGTLVRKVNTGPYMSQATAVVLNVTVTEPTASSFLTVYPTGVERPTASNLNFVAGQTVANLVTVGLGDDGQISIFNRFGNAHVVADLVGYYRPPSADPSDDAGRFIGTVPERLIDTRRMVDGPLGPDEIGTVVVAESEDVMGFRAGAAVLNLTATEPTTAGYLTAFPDDLCEIPRVSNLNFAAGRTVPNAALVRLSDDTGCAIGEGAVSVYNPFGSTHVIVDVFGYFVR